MSRYQLLSIAEVARQLNRKRWFVADLIDQQKLAICLIGKRRYVLQRDLDDYVQRSRRPALGEPKSKAKEIFQEAEAAAKAGPNR